MSSRSNIIQGKALVFLSKQRTEYREKVKKYKYDKWLTENMFHLVNMYELADIEFNFDIFCKYVYNNSEINY